MSYKNIRLLNKIQNQYSCKYIWKIKLTRHILNQNTTLYWRIYYLPNLPTHYTLIPKFEKKEKKNDLNENLKNYTIELPSLIVWFGGISKNKLVMKNIIDMDYGMALHWVKIKSILKIISIYNYLSHYYNYGPSLILYIVLKVGILMALDFLYEEWFHSQVTNMNGKTWAC